MKHAPHRLVERVSGNFRHDDPTFGDFVTRDLRQTVVAQFRRQNGCRFDVVFELHVGRDDLTQPLIRRADHHGIVHLVMHAQNMLSLNPARGRRGFASCAEKEIDMAVIPLSEVPEKDTKVLEIEGKRVLVCRSAAE